MIKWFFSIIVFIVKNLLLVVSYDCSVDSGPAGWSTLHLLLMIEGENLSLLEGVQKASVQNSRVWCLNSSMRMNPSLPNMKVFSVYDGTIFCAHSQLLAQLTWLPSCELVCLTQGTAVLVKQYLSTSTAGVGDAGGHLGLSQPPKLRVYKYIQQMGFCLKE